MTNDQNDPQCDRLTRLAQGCQATLASVAIVAAGIWFMTQGLHKPRIDISQTVTDRQFSESHIWLRVQIAITNNGLTKYTIPKGESRVSQVMPPPVRIVNRLKDDIQSPTNDLGYFDFPWVSRVCISPSTSVDHEEDKDFKRCASREIDNLFAVVEPDETIEIIVDHVVSTQLKTVHVLAEFESTSLPSSVRSNGVIYDLESNNAG